MAGFAGAKDFSPLLERMSETGETNLGVSEDQGATRTL